MQSPARGSSSPRANRRRIGGRKALFLVLCTALALSACQVQVDVATKVNEDGSGSVTVGMGFDDKALTRIGNPDTNIKLDDKKATGWVFTPAAKEPDGLTWIHGTKTFANPEEGTAILHELTDGPAFKDFQVTRDSSLGRTSWSYKGTVDLTHGLDGFGDAELAAALNGDPYGGNVADIEKAEQKPATQMIGLHLSVDLPAGESRDWRPTFADPSPTQLALESSQTQPIPVLPAGGGNTIAFVLVVLLVVALAIGVGLVLRNRFRTYH